MASVNENNQKSARLPALRAVMLIATPKLADEAADMCRQANLPLQFRFNAQGTASSEIMDMLGLGSIDKSILCGIAPKSSAQQLLEKLHRELRLDSRGSGIAFTIPLSGASSIVPLMLSREFGEAVVGGNDKDNNNEKKGDETVTQFGHALISAIVNRGFSDMVMDAAKAAGAGGGTIVHSLSLNNEIAKDYGIASSEEKEIVLILARAEDKLPIMQAVGEKCGVLTDAAGIILSLPIDSVLGF